jgi:short-subunit dehydrogenase
VLAKERGIDVLVNAAGYGVTGAFEELTLGDAEKLIATNFFGTLRVTLSDGAMSKAKPARVNRG